MSEYLICGNCGEQARVMVDNHCLLCHPDPSEIADRVAKMLVGAVHENTSIEAENAELKTQNVITTAHKLSLEIANHDNEVMWEALKKVHKLANYSINNALKYDSYDHTPTIEKVKKLTAKYK